MSTVEFTTQMMSFQEQMRKFAFKLTSDYDEAQDLMQETYIKAIKYKDSFTDSTNLKAWLLTIMKNTFINVYRKNLRKGQVFDAHVTTASDRLHQKASNNATETRLYEQDLRKLISALPTEYRTPFEMYVEGYKYKEIGEHMNLPIGTIKSRIHIARQELMTKINRQKK
ncbi:MAG: RNA polymerase sigma factor [Sphingobacteriales bacterium JAD_PAG50586_3]|nr:MAG: RNA polymerase sigma factor [Sphingobacteriales bacterium JAD_PAG50586_3]